jgi:hypothetical protein
MAIYKYKKTVTNKDALHPIFSLLQSWTKNSAFSLKQHQRRKRRVFLTPSQLPRQRKPRKNGTIYLTLDKQEIMLYNT